jgi:hypothetical protein
MYLQLLHDCTFDNIWASWFKENGRFIPIDFLPRSLAKGIEGVMQCVNTSSITASKEYTVVRKQ